MKVKCPWCSRRVEPKHAQQHVTKMHSSRHVREGMPAFLSAQQQAKKPKTDDGGSLFAKAGDDYD